MKNFCTLPFAHTLVTTDGSYQVCCVHRAIPEKYSMNMHHRSFNEWWSGEYMQQVRQAFLDDRRHPGCDFCWQKEDNGFPSHRTRAKQEYIDLGYNLDSKNLLNAEIQVGNLCNLGCHMCDEKDSSYLLAENIKLKINQVPQKKLRWETSAFDNLHEILAQRPKVLNIRGGEPLYNKDLLTILDSLPHDYCQSIEILHITTNGTVWSERWQNTLSRFPNVRIMASIDAVGSVYEYMRYPADWRQVEKNLLSIKSQPNINLMVYAVVQNLNVLHISDLVDWCSLHNIWLELEMLVSPKHLRVENLSQNWLDESMSRLSKLKDNSIAPHLERFVDALTIHIQKNTGYCTDATWQDFLKKVVPRDELRSTDYRKILF